MRRRRRGVVGPEGMVAETQFGILAQGRPGYDGELTNRRRRRYHLGCDPFPEGWVEEQVYG